MIRLAIENKRMQQRSGTFAQYQDNQSSVLPNELIVVTSGDPNTTDEKAAYLKIGTTTQKRIVFSDELTATNSNVSTLTTDVTSLQSQLSATNDSLTAVANDWNTTKAAWSTQVARTVSHSAGIRYDIDTETGIITASITVSPVSSAILFCKDKYAFFTAYSGNQTTITYNFGTKISGAGGTTSTWAFVAATEGTGAPCFTMRNLGASENSSDRLRSTDLVIFVLHLLNSSHLIYKDNKIIFSDNVYIDGVSQTATPTEDAIGIIDSWFCLKSNPGENVQARMKKLEVEPSTHYRFLINNTKNISKINTVCIFNTYDSEHPNDYTVLDRHTVTADGSSFFIDVDTPSNGAILLFNALMPSSGVGSFTLTQFSSETATIDGRVRALENREVGTNKTTCKIFKKVVCCGDSYTAGYIDIREDTEVEPVEGVDRLLSSNYSWVHYMATMTGNNWINCGVSGANVLTWRGLYDEYNASKTSGAVIGHENPSLADTSGYHTAQQAGQTQAYILGLLINDSTPRKTEDGIEVPTPHHVDLGESSDIGAEYPTTFYGGLSKIIRDLHSISPKAKIFVNTCPKNDSSDRQYSLYNQAVRHVVNYYKNNYAYPVHCIDLANHSDLYSNSSLTGDYINGHYTAIGYEQFAEIYALLLSDYINTHISEFQDVAFIPITNGNGE